MEDKNRSYGELKNVSDNYNSIQNRIKEIHESFYQMIVKQEYYRKERKCIM